MQERRKIWRHLNDEPFAIRRMGIKFPIILGAAYGTQMVERRVLLDRRKASAKPDGKQVSGSLL